MNAEHPERGLSGAEAEARLQAEGYNELPRENERTLLKIVLEVLKEPMFQLLLAAGAIYLVLGDLGEALLLLAFAMGSILITIVQQTRTERALEALRDLSSPRALVIRDGVQQRIPGREVVRGDRVLLNEGDRVPADIRLLRVQDLQADESLLTGESVPVGKRAAFAEDGLMDRQPGGDDQPCIYSGTLIVRGTGVGEVYATGLHSELGRIGQLLGRVKSEPTSLHVQTRRIVRLLATSGLSLSVLIALLYGFMREAWLEGMLAGIALAMALLPEEFPLVLTVFLAMGAAHMARRSVLTRRASAIEALGSATILCTDKTGTLTQNRMSVAELHDGSQTVPVDGDLPLPAGVAPVLQCAVLASRAMPVDPMEKALHVLARSQGQGVPTSGAVPAREYGLSPELPAMTMAWQDADADAYRVATKGAPEAVAALCGLDAQALATVRLEADRMAARGLRVLGVAGATHRGPLPQSQTGFERRWLGLVAFADPLRPTVPQAIRECRAAGIRVAMITGDYPATARAIANQAGIADSGLLAGAELESLSDAALRERVRQVSVYARVTPQQKLRIVEALKANGEVVAMTGDGVNDAPSLKSAHIGVAMGGRGTDVARESAGLVLLDDDFGSLVTAVREGRRIYDNLRKAMAYIIAVHVPIAGLSVLPLLLGWPIILAPVHIVFLELVIDPVCSIVFEAEREEADVMRRPPRSPQAPLFSRGLLLWSLLQGLGELAVVTTTFLVALRSGMSLDSARAMTFAALVSTHVALIFVNRSLGSSIRAALSQPNRALWPMLLATATMLLLVLYLPQARDLFDFGFLSPVNLAITLVCGFALFLGLALLGGRRRAPAG